MTRADWITAFVDRLRALGIQGPREHLADMATQIHSIHGNLDPCAVAQDEWDLWPLCRLWSPSDHLPL